MAALALALSFVLMSVWIRMMAVSFATFQQVYLRLLLAGLLALALFRKSFSRQILISIRFGWWLYSEVPTRVELMGAAIILACGYAVSALDAKRDRLEAAQADTESV